MSSATTLAPGLNLVLPLLRPPIALALWTFAMEAWMYATRIPAIEKYKVPITPSATKEEFNRPIPAPVRWKADNYMHLHEQPTVFYAVVGALAIARAVGVTRLASDTDWDLVAAWGYVGLRVVHSLVQATVNKIMLRFSVFLASSTVLLGLTLRAASAVGLY